MAYEKKELVGSLFRNRDKRSETHADLKGDILIDGQEFWMNGWENKDKNGNTWIKVTLSKKQPRPQSDAPAKTQSKHDIELSDDIPF